MSEPTAHADPGGEAPYLVSACLAGVPCRYDGKAKTSRRHAMAVADGTAVLACAETLAGLSTPRRPAEIVGGDGADVLDGRAEVHDDQGNDVTDAFVAGAAAVSRLAASVGATRAVLMERSPSCGSAGVYDGTFSGHMRGGQGVTAARLIRDGLDVVIGTPDDD